MEDVLYFETAQDFRAWLHKHHDKQDAQWIGFYKKATGIPSINWSESVDQALCYGWIDGLRKRVDEQRYKIRFTPRRKNSHWSAVNLKKMKELHAQDLIMPAGQAIFEQRKESNSQQMAYEKAEVPLHPNYLSQLQANEKAWDFYQNRLAPSYKKISTHWVMSAKRSATQERRLGIFIESCEAGLKIPLLRKK